MSWDINQIIEGLNKCLDSYEAAAIIHVEPLAQMLKDSPDKAINMIFDVYNRALDAAYTNEEGKNLRAFIEATAGGPHEMVPSAIYNAVGEVYPYLERPQKNRALIKVLDCMDKINYAYVQISHTPFIREPLLLSDIKITRWLYWPGLHDEENLWKGKQSFYEIHKEIMDENGMFRKNIVKSDFLVACALLRKDFCSFGNEYAEAANPQFLERVIKGIVAIRFAHTKTTEDVSRGKARLEELLPESLHSRIEPLRLERDWVDPTLPEFR
ncbi:MAG: hypothetical protein WC979_08525 [Candidatus Pacearchaeota archaeon]|jgi:hypothetical protein